MTRPASIAFALWLRRETLESIEPLRRYDARAWNEEKNDGE